MRGKLIELKKLFKLLCWQVMERIKSNCKDQIARNELQWSNCKDRIYLTKTTEPKPIENWSLQFRSIQFGSFYKLSMFENISVIWNLFYQKLSLDDFWLGHFKIVLNHDFAHLCYLWVSDPCNLIHWSVLKCHFFNFRL